MKEDTESNKKSLIEKLAGQAWRDPQKWWVTPLPKFDGKTPALIFLETGGPEKLIADLSAIIEGVYE